MKPFSSHHLAFAFLFVGLGIISGGCRPSVREVAGILSNVPLGASRDDVRKVLVEAYGKKYPKWKQSYALVDPPSPVTAQMIKADEDLIALSSKERHYVEVYPPSLYQNLPSMAFTDAVGLVAEASEGDGSVSIYYDSRTNYIGFLSYSTARMK